MDDSVVLKFLYKGKGSDIFVDDVDLDNLLDMIVDYWDTTERKEHLMLNILVLVIYTKSEMFK